MIASVASGGNRSTAARRAAQLYEARRRLPAKSRTWMGWAIGCALVTVLRGGGRLIHSGRGGSDFDLAARRVVPELGDAVDVEGRARVEGALRVLHEDDLAVAHLGEDA